MELKQSYFELYGDNEMTVQMGSADGNHPGSKGKTEPGTEKTGQGRKSVVHVGKNGRHDAVY